MKVKKGKKVIIVNDELLKRYIALGYEVVSDENVSSRANDRKKK